MSASDTFGSPIVETIDEIGSVTFARMSGVEYGEMEDLAKKSLIDHHLSLLTLAGVEGEKKYYALSAAVPERITIDHVYQWAGTPKAINEILSKSLAKGRTPKEIADRAVTYFISRAHRLDRFNLISAVLGIGKRMTLAEILADIDKRSKESNPNPQAGSDEKESTGPSSSAPQSDQAAPIPVA